MIEVARRDTPWSGYPDTDGFRNKFVWVYLEEEKICVAVNSNLVSEEHGHVRTGTTGPNRRVDILIQTIFEKTLSGVISRNRKICIAEHSENCIRGTWPCKWWHDRTLRWAVLLVLLNLEKILSSNILITCKFIFLKIRTSYRENMSWRRVHGKTPRRAVLEVRTNFEKNFHLVNFGKQQIWLADNPNIVSEEHDHDRAGTTGHPFHAKSSSENNVTSVQTYYRM